MKSFKFKKITQPKRKLFIMNVMGTLEKPHLPRIVFFKVHKPKIYVEFVLNLP